MAKQSIPRPRAKGPVKKNAPHKPSSSKKYSAKEIENYNEYMDFKILPISSFFKFKGNPRYMSPEGHERLQHSFKTHKWTNPVLLWQNPKTKKFEILAGHQRVTDASEIGIKKAPCLILKQFKDRASAMAYVVADNQFATLSTWDMPLLKEAMDEIVAANLDILDTGFSADEFEVLLKSEMPEWDEIEDLTDHHDEDEDRDVLAGRIVVRTRDGSIMDSVRDQLQRFIDKMWADGDVWID